MLRASCVDCLEDSKSLNSVSGILSSEQGPGGHGSPCPHHPAQHVAHSLSLCKDRSGQTPSLTNRASLPGPHSSWYPAPTLSFTGGTHCLDCGFVLVPVTWGDKDGEVGRAGCSSWTAGVSVTVILKTNKQKTRQRDLETKALFQLTAQVIFHLQQEGQDNRELKKS